MGSKEISRRLPRGFDGSDRRKSRSGRKRNRRKTETETTAIHESDRSRVGSARELEQDAKIPSRAQEFRRVTSQKSRVITSAHPDETTSRKDATLRAIIPNHVISGYGWSPSVQLAVTDTTAWRAEL